MSNGESSLPAPREVKIKVHDGIEIAVALYMPEGSGPFPALLAPSPYRYDNNSLPASPQFLWRETGPIDFYVKRGYVYANMDVRGCGKSGGEFRLLDRNEQRDLYDVIEWLGHQQWSSGKVGGIGQSYFCMSQWWMAIQKPPSLACIAAFDGLNDPYRASVYQGGILGDFFGSYWWNQNRIINRHPANGAAPREQPCDLNLLVQQHPTYDDFWRERAAAERLDEIEVPLYSIAIWGKVDLHTRGNIDGYRRAKGPKKLRINGPPNAFAANREFNSAEMHENLLLPFYEHYLKGKESDWQSRSDVEWFVRGADTFRTAATWPPPGVRYDLAYRRAEERQRHLAQRRQPDAGAARRDSRDLLQLSQSRLDDGRHRHGAEQPTRPGPPNPHLHHRAPGAGSRNRRADQAHALCLVDRHRHGFLRQAVGAVAAIARGSRQGPEPRLVLDH